MSPMEMVVIGVALAVMVAVGAVIAYQRRLLGRQAEQLADLSRKLEIFQQSLHALTASAAGADQRMYRLEAQERLLSERQETIENQRVGDEPYAQAINLVQQGAGVRRLVDELGLSETEAELIFRLHGLKTDA